MATFRLTRGCLSAALLCAGMLYARPLMSQSLYPGQYETRTEIGNEILMKAGCFDLQDVKLLPGRFRENMQRDSAWIVSLGTDRLLHSFRTTAGVYAGREGGYMTVRKLGGWESLDCELRGHITGHMMSACALMYASTGSDVFKAKGDSLVTGLADVQKAYADGYLSAFPQELINRNMRGESVWAPWYTLHKIMAGLLDQYLYADNELALEVAARMGDWAYYKLMDVDESVRRRMLRNEFGGINEAFYNLWALTGEDRYLQLARFFYHNDVIDPLKKSEDNFGTSHTNTFIPKVIAEARNYELTGDEESRSACMFFWNEMTGKHMFAPGCCSDKEHFFDTGHLSEHITGYTGETCCTYNMLKLARHIFCWTASPAVFDYYERALYNHILGQQDPETGMYAYFLPLLPGAYKVYSTPENSFWCCIGSGLESNAKYAESIYFHDEDGLFVNLFIPSVLDWKEKGIVLRQETVFPEEETVTLAVSAEKPVHARIRLRYPSWSENARVAVNGRQLRISQKPGSYIEIDRVWKEGDRIEVRYPMHLALDPTPDRPDCAALVYGPVVLAGELGTAGMSDPAPYSDPAKYNDYYTYDYNIPDNLDTELRLDAAHPEKTFIRTGRKLEFTAPNGTRLSPLYDVHRQRYIVYWTIQPVL